MVNYRDRFTDEQLEELYHFSFVECDNKSLSFDDTLPASVPELSDEVRRILTDLFTEHREKYPDEYLTPFESLLLTGEETTPDMNVIVEELDELLLQFWHDVVFEIFKDRIEIHDDGTVWTRAGEQPAEALAIYGPNTASLIITHPKLKGALLPQKNDTAYVINIDNQLQWTWNADGTPVINTVSESKEIDDLLERKDIPSDCADTELLEVFAGAVASAYICNYRDRITVNYPSFFRALGTKQGSEKNHHADPMERIKQLENVGGVLVEQKKIQRVFVWVEIDETNKTLTFESPYLYSIMDMLKQHPVSVSTKLVNNRPRWTIYGISFLGRTERYSAKNKITVQVAEYLTVRLHQHGKTSDASHNPGKTYNDPKLVKCEVKYSEIIANCPRLREAIDKAPKRTTQILQRSILGPNFDFNPKTKGYKHVTLIEEYLRKYFIIFDYWKDLKIKVEPVTVKALDNKITFTHHGYRGDFQDPLKLPSINGQTPDLTTKGGSV